MDENIVDIGLLPTQSKSNILLCYCNIYPVLGPFFYYWLLQQSISYVRYEQYQILLFKITLNDRISMVSVYDVFKYYITVFPHLFIYEECILRSD